MVIQSRGIGVHLGSLVTAMQAVVAAQQSVSGPNFEGLLIFCGLAAYLSPFLRGVTSGWSPHYLTILYVFAALYYLIYRKLPTDARLVSTGTTPS